MMKVQGVLYYRTGGYLPTYDASLGPFDWLHAARLAWRFAKRTNTFAMVHLPNRLSVLFCGKGWTIDMVEAAGNMNLAGVKVKLI